MSSKYDFNKVQFVYLVITVESYTKPGLALIPPSSGQPDSGKQPVALAWRDAEKHLGHITHNTATDFRDSKNYNIEQTIT